MWLDLSGYSGSQPQASWLKERMMNGYRVACNIFVNDNEASDDPAFEKCGPRREMIGFELLVYGMIEEIARNFVRKT